MSQLVWEIFIGHSVFDYQDLFSNKKKQKPNGTEGHSYMKATEQYFAVDRFMESVNEIL